MQGDHGVIALDADFLAGDGLFQPGGQIACGFADGQRFHGCKLFQCVHGCKPMERVNDSARRASRASEDPDYAAIGDGLGCGARAFGDDAGVYARDDGSVEEGV